MSARTVAIYLPDLSGGGAERLHVNLAPALREEGLAPRFLLDRRAGDLLGTVPPGVPVDVLGAARQVAALPRLARYLRRSPPDVLIANMEHMNVMSVLARGFARASTRIVVTQHNAFSEQVKRTSWQWRTLPLLYRAALPHADAIVAVSAGVADDLAAAAGLPRQSITVIHNGVIGADFDSRLAAAAGHPWLGDDKPLVMGMGRFVQQKDFATLLDAFAALDPATGARLILLGEGPMRGELEARANRLGIADRVALPGFAGNPLPWLARADAFVLSSRFEGFGNVVAEALAAGTPVVSTDCPHGPAEILEKGRYGALVPVGDSGAMAQALAAMLAGQAPPADVLRARGREFSVASCAREYRELIARL